MALQERRMPRCAHWPRTLLLLVSILLAGAWPAAAQSPRRPADEPTRTDRRPSARSVKQTQPAEDETTDDAPPEDAPPQDESDGPITEIPDTTVVGQPDPFPAAPLGEDTIVSADAVETTASRTGSTVTVISDEDIAQSRYTDVLDVLRDVPGLDVVQQGGPGGVTSIFLRGSNSNHTKVLLDGVPLNDPSNAGRSFDFSNLDVENIERIEVLRGPQSLLYGSDAIGGVVNIVTRRGNGPLQARANLMGGSYGTSREAVGLSGGTDLYYYSFGGAYHDSDGFSAAAERLGNSERDGFQNGTLSGRYGLTPADWFDVDYVFRWGDSDAEVDDFDFFTGLPFDNPRRRNLSNTFFQRVEARAALLEGAVESRVGFSYADHSRDDTDPGPFSPAEFDGLTKKVDYQLNVLAWEDHTVSAGADYYDERASSSFDPQQSQNDAGVWVQDQLGLWERWYATFGWRWDEHSAGGAAETYRATTVFNLWETGTAVRGSIGTGFRAPALAENFFAFGNPELSPENSKGWDYGIEQALIEDWAWVGATYFYNKYRNLIVFDLNTFLLENVGRAEAHGVELWGRARLDCRTDLNLNYTQTDSEDLATGLPLLRRPRDKASLGVQRRFCCNRLRLGVDVLFVGDRLDTRNRVLQEFWTVNLNGGYDLTEWCELYLRADNLFDEDYEEVAGFGVAGASAYGGARMVW